MTMPVPMTTTELFTPAPSGVGPFGNVPQVPDSDTWLGKMLYIAGRVKLPTTSWQPGDPERTILAIEAVTFSQSDAQISIIAQGGFLQTAASGSVTYVTINGTTVTVPVTPDPSNVAQNPTGAPGWLDELTESTYDVERLAATFAAGPLAIANTTAFSKGPYAAGGYHVASVINGATYHNVDDGVTIPSSVIAGSGGTVVSVSPSATTTTIGTMAAHGLSVGQSVYIVIPISSGISGLAGQFAIVTAATSTTFQVSVPSSGTYVGGGTVYLCTVLAMVADVSGTGSNAPPGAASQAVTQLAGVVLANIVGWSGSNWESNVALADRAQLSLAKASPNGAAQSYVYYARSAAQLLLEASPPYVLTNGPVNATEFANPGTGVVTTMVASATPASSVLGEAVTPGCSQLPIASVSNANPCVIVCAGATSLSPAQTMTVTISGVLGTVGVNGSFLGTYVGPNSFSIPIDTTSAGAYTGGGSVEGGDLGQIDALIQANVVPSGETAITVSARALPIAVVATVVVPQAYVAAYRIAVLQQLQAQIASYDVGGNAPQFEVSYNDIVGALEEAGVLVLGAASYVRQIQRLSLNGGGVGVGVPFPTNEYQAILATPTITVLAT
jgi:hypothetical protein